jgi:hypothetical protein
LGIRSVHADTTSISVAGEYELTGSDRAFVEERPDGSVLDIRHGYSKDRRPDLKQFICGLVVSGEGLPLLGTVQDGNTGDKVRNSQIIDEIRQSFLDPQKVIYVADSALITAANLDKMAQHKMRFISRLPETYHLAHELKERAWAIDRWETIGRIAQSEKGAVYHAQSLEETLEGRTYRFIVVHSSSLDKRKLKAIERAIVKERIELEKAQKQWHKQIFQCREDAASALTAILKEHQDAYHTITGEIVEEQVIRRPPGRPPKNFIPETITPIPHPNAACRTHRRAHSRGACQSQHLRPHCVAFGSGALEQLRHFAGVQRANLRRDALSQPQSRSLHRRQHLRQIVPTGRGIGLSLPAGSDRRRLHRDQDPAGAQSPAPAVGRARQ